MNVIVLNIRKQIWKIGVLMLVLSIGGFLSDLYLDSTYVIYSEQNYNDEVFNSQILEMNHTYDIYVSIESGSEDVSSGNIIILIDAVEMLNENVYDVANWHDSEDGGSSDQAIASSEYQITPSSNVNLTIIGTMERGWRWHFTISKDLPPSIDDLLVTCLCFTFVSMGIMLGGCYFASAAERVSLKMEEDYGFDENFEYKEYKYDENDI